MLLLAMGSRLMNRVFGTKDGQGKVMRQAACDSLGLKLDMWRAKSIDKEV